MARLELDHLVVSTEMLETGVSAIEALLGVPLDAGGKHDLMGTHNRVVRLGDGEYLEVIAIDPSVPPIDGARWYGLDGFAGETRLTNWAARSDSLEAALMGLPPGTGTPLDLERGPFIWRMAVPDDGMLPWAGLAPAAIQWISDDIPPNVLPARGLRLTALTIHHPEATRIGRLLAKVIDDPRITVTGSAEEGTVPRLEAVIEPPNGPVTLG